VAKFFIFFVPLRLSDNFLADENFMLGIVGKRFAGDLAPANPNIKSNAINRTAGGYYAL